MTEIVKYNNFLNSLRFQNFTIVDMNIFMTICAKAKEKKDTEVILTYDEIIQLSDYKSKDIKRLTQDIVRMNNKLMKIVLNVEMPNGTICTFSLFKHFITNPIKKILSLKINDEWAFVLNELTKDFSQFELNEFVSLNNRYTKALYRQLNQYKSTGVYVCEIDKFRDIMDIPKTYSNKYIMDKVVKPSVQELTDKNYFKNLTVISQYKNERGRPLKGYMFTFEKTIIEKKEEIISEVISDEIKQKPKNKFNDFSQRQYSKEEIDELEKRLLSK